MKLYTNTYPIMKGYLCIQEDNTIRKEDLKVLFEAGKIFRVKCLDQQSVILECEGKIVSVSSHLFELGFKETEWDFGGE